MKRFKFRLETVLKHRETIETLREQDFATAQGRVQEITLRMERMQEEIRATILARPNQTPGVAFNPEGFLNRERYIVILEDGILQLRREREAAELVLNVCRRELVAARQAREAVSKLKERERALHQTTVEKMQQDALDELATLRHLREQRAAAFDAPEVRYEEAA